MKSLELENYGVQELDAKEACGTEGGSTGYKPGITFGDSHWYGYSGGSGYPGSVTADRPPDWVDIFFGPSVN